MEERPPETGDGVAVIVRRPEEIAQARDLTLEVAAEAGLDLEKANFLAFAVSEVTANALLHGHSAADVRVTASAAEVTVEVRDTGSGFRPAPPDQAVPDPHADHGRGLWLVEQLVDVVEIDTGPGGTTVRLTMHRASGVMEP